MSTIPQIKTKAELGSVSALEARFLIRRLESTQAILNERNKELLEVKGPCSLSECNLHRAHYGPCNLQGRLA